MQNTIFWKIFYKKEKFYTIYFVSGKRIKIPEKIYLMIADDIINKNAKILVFKQYEDSIPYLIIKSETITHIIQV